MRRHDRLWLQDILGAIRQIQEFVDGFTFESFVVDARTKSAVLQQLAVIGEAASQTPEDIRTRHPEIDWRPMIDFRNRAVHGYFGIIWSIVWDTATREVPELEPLIRELIRLEFPEPEDDLP